MLATPHDPYFGKISHPIYFESQKGTQCGTHCLKLEKMFFQYFSLWPSGMPQDAPRTFRVVPRRSKNSPKSYKTNGFSLFFVFHRCSPGRPQDAPKTLQATTKCPITLPRHPQSVPRRLQDASKMFPRRSPRRPQDALKTP